MKIAAALLVVLLCSACASPTSPLVVAEPCVIPTGPLTLRIAISGHISNAPITGQPAYLRAPGCIRRETTTNADGIAEWQIPAGVYTMEFRQTAFFVDSEINRSVQWVLSFPE